MNNHYFKDNNFYLYLGDIIEILKDFEDEKFDLIYADPPYFLSNDGITCKSGEMVSVNKGNWDISNGYTEDLRFTHEWLKLCRRVLKKNGSIWISGTLHNIYKIGYLLDKFDFKILNDIIWYKPNPPPNLSCRYFTHSHEILLWARKSKKSNHTFNYELMKSWNVPKDKFKKENKQMKSIWMIPPPNLKEKKMGSHPTQKPLALLNRIISSSTNKLDWVLDPFMGSGTTGIVCNILKRNFVGIDNNEEYLNIAIRRLNEKNKSQLIYRPNLRNNLNKYL